MYIIQTQQTNCKHLLWYWSHVGLSRLGSLPIQGVLMEHSEPSKLISITHFLNQLLSFKIIKYDPLIDPPAETVTWLQPNQTNLLIDAKNPQGSVHAASRCGDWPNSPMGRVGLQALLKVRASPQWNKDQATASNSATCTLRQRSVSQFWEANELGSFHFPKRITENSTPKKEQGWQTCMSFKLSSLEFPSVD